MVRDCKVRCVNACDPMLAQSRRVDSQREVVRRLDQLSVSSRYLM